MKELTWEEKLKIFEEVSAELTLDRMREELAEYIFNLEYPNDDFDFIGFDYDVPKENERTTDETRKLRNVFLELNGYDAETVAIELHNDKDYQELYKESIWYVLKKKIYADN